MLLCQPPLPLQLNFTAITDHLRAGKFRSGCGPQSEAGPGKIPIGFWSQAEESAGGGGFAVGPVLLLFLWGPLALHRSGKVPETGRL